MTDPRDLELARLRARLARLERVEGAARGLIETIRAGKVVWGSDPYEAESIVTGVTIPHDAADDLDSALAPDDKALTPEPPAPAPTREETKQ